MNFQKEIIPNICKSMIGKEDFPIYGNGKQTRTYCYVADAVAFMLKVLLLNKFGEIYNVGSEMESYYQRICKVCKGKNISFEEYLEPFEGHASPMSQNLDTTKIRNTFNLTIY